MMFVRPLLLIPALLLASPALALTLDFEEFDHGDIVTGSQGVVITTTNIGGGPDIGVAFDTTETSTSDTDLQFNSPGISGGESGWTQRNLAPTTFLGKVLIRREPKRRAGQRGVPPGRRHNRV